MSDRLVLDSLVAALTDIGQGVAVVDLVTRRFVSANAALAEMFGYTRDDLLAVENFFELLPAAEVEVLEPDVEARTSGAPVDQAVYETRMVRRDGKVVEIEVSAKPLTALEGHHMIALVRDVTLQRTRERETLAAEKRYRTLVERLPVVTYVAEPGENGRWIYVSPQIENMFGYPAQQWLDDPGLWARLVHPDDRELVFEEELRLERGERTPSTEYRMQTRSGAWLWINDDAVLRPEPENGIVYLDGLFSDITDRKVAEGRLRHLADHDALTGLLNRRRFIEDLTVELALIRRSQRSSSVLVVDVDNFKDVNDSLGHHAGDQLIRSVAGLLAAELREADTIARLGGDEFAILLRDTTGEPALAVGQRLIESVREHHFDVADDPVRATASAGIATVQKDQGAAEECLAAADLAMYESKQTGRDRLAVFSPQLRVALEQRRTWADRIRHALEHDDLLLYQQPILDLRIDKVSQYELLVRMRADDGVGVIEPQQFLPVAERFDLVQAIDRWVVGRAIRLIAAAEAEGRDLVLEVNLSGRSLGDQPLFEMLERDLKETGINAWNLVLEVTETAAIENMEVARAFAQRLASLGCRLALDDFGSGFGSFYYLKHLPFDYLKIDGDFVRQLTKNRVDQAVVRSIVQIARTVGYETIAEFVVDEPTLAAVRAFGVHFAQGFHVGAPAPIEELGVSL